MLSKVSWLLTYPDTYDVGWTPGAAVAIAWVGLVVVALLGVLLSKRLPRTADERDGALTLDIV